MTVEEVVDELVEKDDVEDLKTLMVITLIHHQGVDVEYQVLVYEILYEGIEHYLYYVVLKEMENEEDICLRPMDHWTTKKKEKFYEIKFF
jgi:hypothetical protein